MLPAPCSTPEQQLVCADGTGPDPTTGLCADGSQPQSQSFNATAPGVTTPEQQLVCADGTGPDPTTASVLMVHNHKQRHHSIENRQKVKLMCSFSKKDEDRCILYKSTDHNKSYVPVIYFLT